MIKKKKDKSSVRYYKPRKKVTKKYLVETEKIEQILSEIIENNYIMDKFNSLLEVEQQRNEQLAKKVIVLKQKLEAKVSKIKMEVLKEISERQHCDSPQTSNLVQHN